MPSHIKTYLSNNLIWTEGRYIFLITSILFCIGLYANSLLATISFAFIVFTLFFFRNPTRTIPAIALRDPHLLLSPADGRIIAIENIQDPLIGDAVRIAIFLSPCNVHVNWIPSDGMIQNMHYYPGKFIVAFAPKSSDINEHNDIIIKTDTGHTIIIRQIAGFIARRIACWITKGERVHKNQKYGMIRFGSRVELIVPANTNIFVTIHQRVQGISTIIGKLP